MANRIVMGNLGSAYGLKISKPGYDVLTALPGNLLLDSGAPTLRVHSMYTFSFAANDLVAKTITHGLGYSPMHIACWKNVTQNVFRFAMPDNMSSVASTTQFTIGWNSSVVGSPAVVVYVYLLKEIGG